MKKQIVKAGLVKIRRSAKPEKGDFIVESMTGNPNFPSTETTAMLTAVSNASKNLADANLKAATGNRADVAKANELAVVLDNAINAVVLYVQGKANANPDNAKSIIESAGLQVRKTPSPVPAPEAVKVIEAEYTNTPKSIMVSWKMPKHATQSFVYMTSTPDVANSWVLVNSLQGRKLLVDNLVSGTRYYFKVVVANRRNEKSGDSDIASTVAA